MDASELFEAELRRRRLDFRLDGSGSYQIEASVDRLLVSVQNLRRNLTGDERDVQRVASFVDQVVAAGDPRASTAEGLHWCLDANDYLDPPAYRLAVTARLDRILVDVSADRALISWLTPDGLQTLGLSTAEATARAWSNLDAELRSARIETQQADGAVLAMVDTDFPSKASLVLAPALREVIEPIVGWPVLAVMPDRDFLYLWNAAQGDLIPRLGSIVTREFARASYPLSTEVLEVGESIRAIGAYS